MYINSHKKHLHKGSTSVDRLAHFNYLYCVYIGLYSIIVLKKFR